MDDWGQRLRDVGHKYRKGHYPDWVAWGGHKLCVRCTKGGHRQRFAQLVLAPKPIGI